MLYGLAHKENRFLLTMRTLPAGECFFLENELLSYSEPVLLLGYYSDAPTFMSTDRKHLQSLLVDRVLYSSGEGPSCIVFDPHVDRQDLEILSVGKPSGAGDLRPVLLRER